MKGFKKVTKLEFDDFISNQEWIESDTNMIFEPPITFIWNMKIVKDEGWEFGNHAIAAIKRDYSYEYYLKE